MVTSPSFDPWRESPSNKSTLSVQSSPLGRDPVDAQQTRSPAIPSCADLTDTPPPRPQFERAISSPRLSSHPEAPRYSTSVDIDSDTFTDTSLLYSNIQRAGPQFNASGPTDQSRRSPSSTNVYDINGTLELCSRRRRTNVRDKSPCARIAARRSRIQPNIESYYDYIMPDQVNDGTGVDTNTVNPNPGALPSRFLARTIAAMQNLQISSPSSTSDVAPSTPERYEVHFEYPVVTFIHSPVSSTSNVPAVCVRACGTPPPPSRKPPARSPDERVKMPDHYPACER
ncbi:uncharacterized protein EKO05_0001013 [Ascochyta rabiei]|uniref:Uncharacterized protein n=1 Tax=Didymella rabiei TaxID=5454 RepID=A0A163EQ17_DIDRA|nr:uncharacterized protein EKO05_0001013 [Ascochyta rabiei]KZM23836.1 hypothetical protein ST47_g5052 [Ascochyta rabiei]UPX10349.1 hypothetical protein EKO05_0001013 [Ascochyta rabiei]